MTVLLIKVVFGDKKLDNTTCVPNSSSESKQIASHDGYMLNYDNGVSFTYLEGGKLIEIFNPNEDVISSVLNG